jgi:hypothetical protein
VDELAWTPQHDAVAAYLDKHPDASQREVARHLWPGCDGGGTRGMNAGVLMRAVRTFQGAQHGTNNTRREQEQLNQIRQLHAQGLSQNRIMARVFPDIKKGGSKTYYDARDIYRQAISAIVPGNGDEDEDEDKTGI